MFSHLIFLVRGDSLSAFSGVLIPSGNNSLLLSELTQQAILFSFAIASCLALFLHSVVNLFFTALSVLHKQYRTKNEFSNFIFVITSFTIKAWISSFQYTFLRPLLLSQSTYSQTISVPSKPNTHKIKHKLYNLYVIKKRRSLTSHKSVSSSGDQPPLLKSEFKYVYHLQQINNPHNQIKHTKHTTENNRLDIELMKPNLLRHCLVLLSLNLDAMIAQLKTNHNKNNNKIKTFHQNQPTQ